MSLDSTPCSLEILEPRWAPARLFGDMLPPALGADLADLPAEIDGFVESLLADEPLQKMRLRPIVAIDEVVGGGGETTNEDAGDGEDVTETGEPVYLGESLSFSGSTFSLGGSLRVSHDSFTYQSAGSVSFVAGTLAIGSSFRSDVVFSAISRVLSFQEIPTSPDSSTLTLAEEGAVTSNIAGYFSYSGATATLPHTGIIYGGIALTSAATLSFPAGLLNGLVTSGGTIQLSDTTAPE